MSVPQWLVETQITWEQILRLWRRQKVTSTRKGKSSKIPQIFCLKTKLIEGAFSYCHTNKYLNVNAQPTCTNVEQERVYICLIVNISPMLVFSICAWYLIATNSTWSRSLITKYELTIQAYVKMLVTFIKHFICTGSFVHNKTQQRAL